MQCTYLSLAFDKDNLIMIYSIDMISYVLFISIFNEKRNTK